MSNAVPVLPRSPRKAPANRLPKAKAAKPVTLPVNPFPLAIRLPIGLIGSKSVETPMVVEAVVKAEPVIATPAFKAFASAANANKSAAPVVTAKVAKGKQPTVFGYQAASVARLLGFMEFSKAQASVCLANYGVTFTAVTLATYLSDGKRVDEKWGKRAILNAEQTAELAKFKV